MIGVPDGLLDRLASAPRLLVACDFDGVLAPIAPTPDEARIDARAAGAVDRLSTLDRTHVAVVSGRGLDELARLTAGLAGVVRVGSHGAEREGGPAIGDASERREDLAVFERALRAQASAVPGAFVERKPLAVALHYRRCSAESASGLLAAADAEASSRSWLHRLTGSMVVEYCLSLADKGEAIHGLRHELGAAAVLYIGDDVTDEDAFAALRGSDLGVKVGPGPTRAHARLEGQHQVAALLDALEARRRAWLNDSTIVPIERHALLSDQRTTALVDPRGRIVWLCLPRADSAAVFAELLGGPSRGSFSVEPESESAPPRQSYLGDSFVLETRWPSLAVTDYLDCSGGRAYQRAGRSDLVRVIEGRGVARVRFAPRLDFGRLSTELALSEQGVVVEGLSEPLVLYAPGLQWRLEREGAHQTAEALVDLSRGPVALELRCGFAGLQRSRVEESTRRAQTLGFWEGWARALRLPGTRPDLVRRSALALKALVYGPTGAIYAAATTSLPEDLGGQRNWDYRYCWPRDACLAAASLVRLGNTGVAMKLLDWLVAVVARCESPERLKPLYTVAGTDLGPEAEISELEGYAHSRPVRIGNAADHQVQLDVFGPIVDLVAMLIEQGAPVTPEHWRLVEAMVSAVASRWREPDHGIWEVRGPRRHHVHTKVMCWQAVDRALLVASEVWGRRPGEWVALREAIRDDVLSHGWSGEAGAFTFAYGSSELDAASLMIGLTSMVAPDDPRFLSTVREVERVLRDGPTVFRYSLDDGLPGREGGFHICTSWLIESLVLTGQVGRAQALFDDMASLAGQTGLFAEQYDPRARRSLGNYPQAYSHLGLINAAVRLSGGGRGAP